MDETDFLAQRVEAYIKLFDKISGRVGNENAALILDQCGRDWRTMRMRGDAPAEAANNGDQPASSKQISYLEVLGVDAPKGLTKKMASALIDQAQGR